jgi:hypothetical protein
MFIALDTGVKMGNDFWIAEFSMPVAPAAVFVQPKDCLLPGDYPNRKGGWIMSHYEPARA